MKNIIFSQLGLLPIKVPQLVNQSVQNRICVCCFNGNIIRVPLPCGYLGILGLFTILCKIQHNVKVCFIEHIQSEIISVIFDNFMVYYKIKIIKEILIHTGTFWPALRSSFIPLDHYIILIWMLFGIGAKLLVLLNIFICLCLQCCK